LNRDLSTPTTKTINNVTVHRYKPYPAYKNSGLEWLGEVPKHWEVKRLRYLIKYLKGKIPEKFSDTKENDAYLPYLSMEYLRNSNKSELYSKHNCNTILVNDGDLLLLWDGSNAGEFILGKKGILSSTMAKLTIVNDGSKQYLYCMLKYVEIILKELTIGMGIPHVNSNILNNFFCPVPTLEEQNIIGAYLDRETGRIDTLIEKKERQIELLQEKRAALISYAVTKGLDPDVKMKDSGVEWLGEVPEHWGIDRAKLLFQEINERSTTGDETLLTVSHITGVTRRSEKNVNMFMAESLEGYKICEAGDLVINTMWAWMGAMGIAPEQGIVSPSYNVYRFRNKENEPSFYDYLFRTGQFVSEVICHSKGVWSSRLRLYPESFFEIQIPFLPQEEQRGIISLIQKETGSYETLQQKIEMSVEKLREYRTALISAAVTGKIDVRNKET